MHRHPHEHLHTTTTTTTTYTAFSFGIPHNAAVAKNNTLAIATSRSENEVISHSANLHQVLPEMWAPK